MKALHRVETEANRVSNIGADSRVLGRRDLRSFFSRRVIGSVKLYLHIVAIVFTAFHNGVSGLPSGRILDHILVLLPKKDLVACARVSRIWHTHVVPLLYEHIDLVWRCPISMCDRGMDPLLLDPCPCEELGYCDRVKHLDAPVSGVLIPRRHSHHLSSSCIAQPFGSQRSYPSLYLLARTLISTPALARLIQHLRLIGPVPRSVWTNAEQTCLALCDRNRAGFVIDSCSRIPSNQWLEKLDNGEPTAFAALVLACVTELRQLELGPDLQGVLTFISPEYLVKLLPYLNIASIGVSKEKGWMGRGRAPLYESSDAPQLLFLRLPAL